MKWLITLFQKKTPLPHPTHEEIVAKTTRVIEGRDKSAKKIDATNKEKDINLRSVRDQAKVVKLEMDKLDAMLGIAVSQGIHE